MPQMSASYEPAASSAGPPRSDSSHVNPKRKVARAASAPRSPPGVPARPAVNALTLPLRLALAVADEVALYLSMGDVVALYRACTAMRLQFAVRHARLTVLRQESDMLRLARRARLVYSLDLTSWPLCLPHRRLDLSGYRPKRLAIRETLAPKGPGDLRAVYRRVRVPAAVWHELRVLRLRIECSAAAGVDSPPPANQMPLLEKLVLDVRTAGECGVAAQRVVALLDAASPGRLRALALKVSPWHAAYGRALARHAPYLEYLEVHVDDGVWLSTPPGERADRVALPPLPFAHTVVLRNSNGTHQELFAMAAAPHPKLERLEILSHARLLILPTTDDGGGGDDVLALTTGKEEKPGGLPDAGRPPHVWYAPLLRALRAHQYLCTDTCDALMRGTAGGGAFDVVHVVLGAPGASLLDKILKSSRKVYIKLLDGGHIPRPVSVFEQLVRSPVPEDLSFIVSTNTDSFVWDAYAYGPKLKSIFVSTNICDRNRPPAIPERIGWGFEVASQHNETYEV